MSFVTRLLLCLRFSHPVALFSVCGARLVAVEIAGDEDEETQGTQSTQEKTLVYNDPSVDDANVPGAFASSI